MRRLAAAVLAALLAPPALAAPQPVILAAVDGIEEARLRARVDDLVAFGTRYSGTAGCDGAADYLRDELAALGYDPADEPFAWGASTLRNVSVRLPGEVRPDEIWLLVAHYDSTSENRLVSAPGADDNASSVAVILETARVLRGLRFEATIELLLTGGEEQGLLGSAEDTRLARAAGEGFAGVLNMDMVGYWPTGWARDLDACGDTSSGWLANDYARVALDYEPTMPVAARDDWGVCGDDQVSYAIEGWPAIILMNCYEAHLGLNGETVPHYHRTSDLPDTLDYPRLRQVARATAAAIATFAVPITRTLYRNDDLADRAHPAGLLRAGANPVIDPAAPGTTSLANPASPFVASGDGEPVGPGQPGVVVFYETDRDEILTLARTDADSDGALDVVVSWP